MMQGLCRILASSRSVVRIGAAFCALALVALILVGDVAAQPPMGPGGGFPGDGFQGGPNGGGMRGPGGMRGRRGRGGRDAADGNQAEGEKADGENAEGGKDGDKSKEEKKLSLEEALKKSDGKAVLLNQDDFTASDGVKLVANFYRKGAPNPEAPVVVMLHNLKGQKEDFNVLAESLAQAGCVVLVPDLRGCGASGKFQRWPMNNNPPNDREAVRNQISNDDIQAMIEFDGQLWFNFLFYLHQEGYCNVKKTVMIGAEFGAALAASWTKDDWNGKGDYAQNVVGAVLLSPDAENGEDKYDALSSLVEVRKRAKDPVFGCMVVTGQVNEEKLDAAKKIQLKIGGKPDAEAAPEDKKCPIVAIKTDKQGVDLLKYEAFEVPKTVAQYVDLRLKKLPKKRQARPELGDEKSSKSSKSKASKNEKDKSEKDKSEKE